MPHDILKGLDLDWIVKSIDIDSESAGLHTSHFNKLGLGLKTCQISGRRNNKMINTSTKRYV